MDITFSGSFDARQIAIVGHWVNADIDSPARVQLTVRDDGVIDVSQGDDGIFVQPHGEVTFFDPAKIYVILGELDDAGERTYWCENPPEFTTPDQCSIYDGDDRRRIELGIGRDQPNDLPDDIEFEEAPTYAKIRALKESGDVRTERIEQLRELADRVETFLTNRKESAR